MKRIVIVFLIVIQLNSLSAHTFEKTINISQKFYPQFVKEFTDFYIIGLTYFNEVDAKSYPKLFKIDFNGHVIDSLVYNSFSDYRIYDIISLDDDQFITCAAFKSSESSNVTIEFCKMNASFELKKRTQFKTNTDFVKSISGRVSKWDSNLHTFIYAFDAFDGSNNKGYYLFTIDNEINVINNKFIPNLHGKFNIIEEFIEYTSDTLLLFSRYEIYKIDKQLSFCDSIPIHSFFYQSFQSLCLPLNAIKVNNRIVVSGSHQTEDSIVMVLGQYESNLNYLSTLRIGSNYKTNYKALIQSLSTYNDKIYFCGTNKFSWTLFNGHSPSSIRLIKFDGKLNLLWDKSYKGTDDFYYSPTLNLATSDGGNIIVATKFKTNSNNKSVDLYLLKVDSLGNYTPMSINNTQKQHSLTLYPNPGADVINLKTDKPYCEFLLYNLSGQLLLKETLESKQQQISTAKLKPGMYFYKMLSNGVVSNSGKWVKQ